jgi:hypothetical protein
MPAKEDGRAKQWITRVLCGVQCDNKAILRGFRLLEVKELQSAGEHAGLRYCHCQ